MADRYGPDVLSGDWRKPPRGRSEDAVAERGLVVEEAVTGFCGEIMRVERDLGTVELEDRPARPQGVPARAGLPARGPPRRARRARPAAAPSRPTRTASGSRTVADARARVALPSRIYVEGRHDAELVEKVWGDDLRVEGVAVEYLGGIDDLVAVVDGVRPRGRAAGWACSSTTSCPARRRPASREQVSGRAHVLVVGHPYVDVWQSVKPDRLGLDAWPVVPRGTDWKHGVCEALGWPHADQADIARAWKYILGRVDSYADLEPSFLGRVEELIDFVTA